VKQKPAEADSTGPAGKDPAAGTPRFQAGEDINLVPIRTMTATPDPSPPRHHHPYRDHRHDVQEQDRSGQDHSTQPPTEDRLRGRPMKIRHVPLRHGWYWLIEGFTLWAHNPAFLSYLTFGCILTMLAMALVPTAGEALCTLLMPCLTLGVYNGCRAIDRHRKLTPGLLFSGFRRRSHNLLIAGGVYFIAMKGVLLATTLIDDGILRQFIEYDELEAAALDKPAFHQAVLAAFGMLVPSLMAYWFIPQLIGWWRLSVPRALFVSFVACVRNWLAFVVYLFIIVFGLVLVVFIIGLFDFMLPGLGALTRAAFLLIGFPTLFASFYISSRDIFGLPHSRKQRHKETARSFPAAGMEANASAREAARRKAMKKEAVKNAPLRPGK
jgi:hypothetical protein